MVYCKLYPWVVPEGGKKALVSFAHLCFFNALGDHPFAHSCFFIALCDHPWNLFYNIQFVMKFHIILKIIINDMSYLLRWY